MRKLFVAISLTGCVVVAAGGGSRALAQDETQPLRTFGAMVLDDDYGDLFVSAGARGSTIEVFDFQSRLIKTFADEPGASGMVLRPEGLYVLLSRARRIDVIDRESLEIKDSFRIPRPAAPNFLAWTAGRLWFGLGNCDNDRGALASLNPRTRTVWVSTPSSAYHCVGVTAANTVPRALFTFEGDFASPNLTRWDVRGTHLTATVSQVLPERAADFAGASDGDKLFVVQREVGAVACDPKNLVPLWVAGSPATAVSAAPDGRRLVTGGVGSPNASAEITWQDSVGGLDALPLALHSDDANQHAPFDVLPRGIAINRGRLVFAFVRDHDGDEFLDVGGPDDRQEAKADTPLHLAVTTKRASSGTRVRAMIDTSGELPDTDVYLYYATRTRGVHYVDTVHLRRSGKGSLRFEVHHSGSLFASFVPDDDSRRPAVSTPRRISVGPDVILDLYGGRLEKGVVVYRAGAVPALQGSVQPVRQGRLRFESQVKRGGEWRLEDRRTFRMDERGLVPARFKGGERGATYRGRVVYKGHASAWRYFRFGASTRSLTPLRSLDTVRAGRSAGRVEKRVEPATRKSR